eukprot:s2660_g13.t1
MTALSRLDCLVHDQKPNCDPGRPEEALKELLHGGSPYDWRPSGQTLASYQVLPSRPRLYSNRCGWLPLPTDVLPPDDCRYLEEQSELMLANQEEKCEPLVPYWDPQLRYNKKAYNDLVRRLHGINKFRYTTKPACKVGIFFVWKSNKTRLRMITDARLANRCFKAAPGVNLMTSEGFGRFEVCFDDNVFASPEAILKVRVLLGLSDVKDCFHRMCVPMQLMSRIQLEPLFAQRVNEYVSRSVPFLAQARLLHDRGEPLVFHIGVDSSEADHFYVYVDNLGVFGLDSGRVKQVMEELQEKFDGLGLELHASEVASGSVEALGDVLWSATSYEATSLSSGFGRTGGGLGTDLWVPATPACRALAFARLNWWPKEKDGAGRWTIPSDGAQALSEAGWAVDEAFPEIPNAGLRRELWTPTLHGRRRYPEGILELEARAVLKGVRRILMTRFGHDLRQLVLCDNLSIVLTIERFRSKNFVVLRVLRELAAYLFCRNVHLAIRWVPSELNISDEGSRLYDESGENKLLVDLLRDEWPEADGHGALSFAGRLKPTKYEPQTHKDPSFVSQRSGSESLKRSRRLELESEPGLKRRLLEKKVGTARLPTSDSAVSQIVPVKSQKLEDEGIESGSTSSEFGVERTAGRERGLRKRPRRGLRTFVDSRMGPRAGCHSLLEEAAVSTKVRATYSKRLKELWDVEVDDALVKMFNHLFKEGEGSSTGDYILAALIDRFPQFGKLGSRKIPRSMAGSARLEKVVPISLAACLPPRDLVRHQLEDGALLKLRKMGLVPPTKGVTGSWSVVTSLSETDDVSETGTKDDSVLVDSSWLWLQFAGPLFQALSRGRPMDRVWEFDYSQYLPVFHDCCSDLKLSLVPYQARHSGPSIDRSTNVRTQEEVRKKGGWQSRQSVARYEKSGRLAATWQGLNQSVQLACRSAERYIEEIMLGRDFPDIPLPGQ